MRAKLHSAACIQCKAQDERQNTVLLKVGADRVVLREVGGGERLAYQLTIPATLVQLAVGADHSMLELSAPASLAGRLPVARYHC